MLLVNSLSQSRPMIVGGPIEVLVGNALDVRHCVNLLLVVDHHFGRSDDALKRSDLLQSALV